MKKRLLAMLLAMLMVLGTLPMSAFADEPAPGAGESQGAGDAEKPAGPTVTEIAKEGAVATKDGEKVVLANYDLSSGSSATAPWTKASLTIVSVTPAKAAEGSNPATDKTIKLKLSVTGLGKSTVKNQQGYWIGIGVPFKEVGTNSNDSGFLDGSAFWWDIANTIPAASEYTTKDYSNGTSDGFVAGGWSTAEGGGSVQTMTVGTDTFIGRYFKITPKETKDGDAAETIVGDYNGYIIVKDPTTADGKTTWTYTVYDIDFEVLSSDAGTAATENSVKAANLTGWTGTGADYKPAGSHATEYKAENKTEDGKNVITITATGLEKTENSKGMNAYWVGVGLPQQANVKYAWGSGTKPTVDSEVDYGPATDEQTIGSDKYDTVYWGWASPTGINRANTSGGWLSVKTSDGKVVDYTVKFVVTPAVPTVVAAPMGDHPAAGTAAIPAAELGTVTVGTVAYNAGAYELTVTGNNIVKHTNDNSTDSKKAPWVGIGLPIEEGTGVSYTYAEVTTNSEPQETTETPLSSVAGRTIEEDGAKYNTVYFDEAGDYVIKQTKTTTVDGKESKAIVTYKVKVIINEIAEVVSAPIADHGTPAITEGLGTVTVATTNGVAVAGANKVYNVTLTGDSILPHTNAANTVGTWAGFGMPIDGTSTYSYQLKEAEDADTEYSDPMTSVAERVYTVGTGDDAKSYNTIYFAKSGEYTVKQTKAAASQGGTAEVTIYNVKVAITQSSPAGSTVYTTADIAPANLTGYTAEPYKPEGNHATKYETKVEEKDGKHVITITAENLEQTRNTNDQDAYWVGLALPKNPTATYAKGFGTMPTTGLTYGKLTTEQTVDSNNYVTTYWGFSSETSITNNTTGWLSVRTSDGKIVNYTVNFSITPKDEGETPAITAVPANLTGWIDGEGDAYKPAGNKADSYTATLTGSTIAITATNLDKTENTAGTSAYWVGVGLTHQDGAKYAWGYGDISAADLTKADAYGEPTSHQTVGGKNYDTLYWGAPSAADKQGANFWTNTTTGYVSVKVGNGEPVNYTVTFTVGTKPEENPPVTETPTIVAAPLADHPYAPTKPDDDVVTNEAGVLGTVSIGAVTATENKTNEFSFTVTGGNIVKHRNANGTVGYWVGFGMPVADTTKTYNYTVDGTAVASITGRRIEVDGKTYETVYFDLNTEASEHTIVQAQGTTTVATYVVTVAGTKAADPAAGTVYTDAEVKPANLTAVSGETGPQFGHAGKYETKVESKDGVNTITITAEGLEQTTNANGVDAYWVGLALKETAGTTYAKGFGVLPELTPGLYGPLSTVQDETFKTTYWGFSAPEKIASNKTGWLSVKDAEGKVVNYVVNFNITPKTENAPDTFKVVPAPLVDQADPDKTGLGKVEVGTITMTGTTYYFTLTGDKIVEHQNAQPANGYWMGMGMPVDATKEYTYTVDGKTVGSIPGRRITVDGATYETVYFDLNTEAGEHTIVQTQGDTTVTYIVTVGGTKAPTDTTALSNAITAAETNLNSVVVGTDASQVDKGTSFVSQTAKDTYRAAIEAAKLVLNKQGVAPSEVANALATLNGATNIFNAAKGTGTKDNGGGTVIVPPGGGLGGGTTTTPNTTTTTTTNPDGTKTTTVTDTKTGTVTATTEKKDGSVEVVETKKDGTVTETTTDKDGAKVEKVTTPKKDVTITATDKDGEVLAKVELPAEIPAPETRFDDVPEGHWSDEAIHNMAALEIVNGIGNNTFNRKGDMKRGDLALILSRLSSATSKSYDLTFADVPASKYYANGVAWAARTGVVTGRSADTFAPEDTITREELAVMLYRYAKLLKMDTDAAKGDELDAFNDGDRTHSWAAEGMAWCVNKGILQGKGNGILDPRTNVTRAEVAVMIQRFMDLMK